MTDTSQLLFSITHVRVGARKALDFDIFAEKGRSIKLARMGV